MKAILVFIDGTICDARERYKFSGTADFYQHDRMLEDHSVPGSVACLNKLAKAYAMVYIGARPESTRKTTVEWLGKHGYPEGEVLLAEEQDGRLSSIKEAKCRFDFIAGIGDRWDDNELHFEIGCLSLILKEHEGKWETVAGKIEQYHQHEKIKENQLHLRGKVEGLARVCPLLLSQFGDGLWGAYHKAVREMAENTREARRMEDLASFARYNLSPTDLRDAARWDALLRDEDWENNPVYGLQESELVEATQYRYVHRVTRCFYADLWKSHGKSEIGYQIHCRTDAAWWDRPAWNEEVRFEQPKTLMQGDEHCLFIQYLPQVVREE